MKQHCRQMLRFLCLSALSGRGLPFQLPVAEVEADVRGDHDDIGNIEIERKIERHAAHHAVDDL